MKLTDKQKKQLRKEVEQEKRPRILNFETEINKKKNQNKTIDEIMKMVEDSKAAANNFIFDDEERFNKRLAEKINTEFVDFKVNNRGEIVIKVLDDNKPRNITFYHPLGGHPFIKVGGEHAYYQCKNPLKKWHSAEQAIELILAKLK